MLEDKVHAQLADEGLSEADDGTVNIPLSPITAVVEGTNYGITTAFVLGAG